MDKVIRVGARGSKLRFNQAKKVLEILNKKGFKTEFVPVTTKGDRERDKPLFKISGVGIFVKEIERKILEGEIDIAVHSAKDVPTQIEEGLEISCYLKRESPFDVLVSHVNSLYELKKGGVVGTSSIRRREFLLEKRADLIIKDLRGNIDTRIKKWERGEYDAIIISEVAIKRLNLNVPYVRLDIEEFPPSPGQGAICIESKKDFIYRDVLKEINDEKTFIEVETEREILSKLSIGCSVPFGAYAFIDNGEINLILKYKKGKEFIKIKEKGKTKEELVKKVYEKIFS